jgi:hypothetical protein
MRRRQLAQGHASRALWIAAVFAALLVLAGCGGKSGEEATGQPADTG